MPATMHATAAKQAAANAQKADGPNMVQLLSHVQPDGIWQCMQTFRGHVPAAMHLPAATGTPADARKADGSCVAHSLTQVQARDIRQLERNENLLSVDTYLTMCMSD